MKSKIDELLERIAALQDELEAEYRNTREEWERKKTELADEFLRQQRRYKTSLFRFLVRSRILVLLTAPLHLLLVLRRKCLGRLGCLSGLHQLCIFRTF